MSIGIHHNEKDLFRLIAEGNELAFRRFFDLHNKKLFIFAMELLKSSADAEEIVQESFTKLWVNRKDLADIDNPGGYLYRIVRNSTLDLIRKIAREKKLIDQVWANISQADNSLEYELLEKESQELIEHALLQLPEQKQTVYRLSREKAYDHERIASITGLSKSRINNILVETLKHIKAHLAQHSIRLAIAFWLYNWDRMM